MIRNKLRLPITVFSAVFLTALIVPLGVYGHDPAKDLDCLQCHTCEKPTASNRCLRSCPSLTAANITSDHPTKEAPDNFMIGEIADLYQPVKFNHKLHAEMAEMGSECAICHHYSPKGENIPPCKECHGGAKNPNNLRQPSLKGAYHRQCLSCHREWSHDTKCIMCHLPEPGKAMASAQNDSTDILGISHPIITVPARKVYDTPYKKGRVVTFYHQEHIDRFDLTCANCHKQENCSYCHDLQRDVSTNKTMEQVHAICNDCHANDPCSRCHSTQEMPPFNHGEITGWALSDYHQDLECRNCHPTGQRITSMNGTCTNCHAGWNQANFRHANVGLRLDETHAEIECETCHIDAQYHAKPVCSDCHDDISPTDTPPGERISMESK